MRTICLAVAAAALSVASGCALFRSDAAPAEHRGGALVDTAKKMTLYTFDKDPGGRSVCNGPCAANWPPFVAGAADKDVAAFTKVKRDDGTLQWAYKGKPLYFRAGDEKPGDATGEGFDNLWRVAK
jgi:predicted lipoprotein with Yx(FWY)xxD motif